MVIFRARIRASRAGDGYRKGQHVGYKLFDAKNLEDAKRKVKSLVGAGRKVSSIETTRLMGSTKSRAKMPRSKRFGSGYC